MRSERTQKVLSICFDWMYGAGMLLVAAIALSAAAAIPILVINWLGRMICK